MRPISPLFHVPVVLLDILILILLGWRFLVQDLGLRTFAA